MTDTLNSSDILNTVAILNYVTDKFYGFNFGTTMVASAAPFVDDEGKEALTIFRVLRRFGEFATLIEAKPVTGRTHQIRVHALHAGHEIAGDSKYGDEDFTREIRDMGGKRLFLHAYSLRVPLPEGGELLLEAPVDEVWARTLERLGA